MMLNSRNSRKFRPAKFLRYTVIHETTLLIVGGNQLFLQTELIHGPR